MRYPLIDPQGNFGSIDNDPPAAMRYTEARLSRLATEMLRDIDADTVDFGPNYDESRQEPLVLPARFPNLLVNGSSGIAVGMATNIPPHNLRETIDAVVAYIDDPEIDVERPDEAHQGPRLPDRRDHRRPRRASATRTRPAAAAWSCAAAAHIEPMERGKERIIVTEMPYQVYKGDGRGDGSGLMQKIVEQVQNGRIKEISDLRDESDKSGIRLVIELKRDAIPKVVLNKLYKHTQLQTTFGVNMVALVDGVPRTLGLLPIVKNYVDHQRDVIVRRTKYELREKRGPPPHPRGPARRDREHRRGHRADPRLERPRRRARRADRALRAVAHPGAGDPRPAPPAPHRAPDERDQDRARRRGRADQVAARHPRRRGARSWA